MTDREQLDQEIIRSKAETINRLLSVPNERLSAAVRDAVGVLTMSELEEVLDRRERIGSVIAEVRAVCQRYASAASNPGAHELAGRILKLTEGY